MLAGAVDDALETVEEPLLFGDPPEILTAEMVLLPEAVYVPMLFLSQHVPEEPPPTPPTYVNPAQPVEIAVSQAFIQSRYDVETWTLEYDPTLLSAEQVTL